ncbi:MAG: hypothetical protein H0W23_09515, partial [Chloroflexia bacterium]|nr:hypothetical protein [Chloroflexia bacterium]
ITDFLDARRGRNEARDVSGWRWMLTRAARSDGEAGEFFGGRVTLAGPRPPAASTADHLSTNGEEVGQIMVPAADSQSDPMSASPAAPRSSPGRFRSAASSRREGKRWAPFRAADPDGASSTVTVIPDDDSDPDREPSADPAARDD